MGNSLGDMRLQVIWGLSFRFSSNYPTSVYTEALVKLLRQATARQRKADISRPSAD